MEKRIPSWGTPVLRWDGDKYLSLTLMHCCTAAMHVEVKPVESFISDVY